MMSAIGFEAGWVDDRSQRRERASRRAALLRELARFAVVCGILLALVRPLGVVVALVWGLRILRRDLFEQLVAGLRDRLVEQELHGLESEDWRRWVAGREAAGEPALREEEE